MEPDNIQQKIIDLRGCRVMLDFDLALLFNVATKALNQSVKRNAQRFPADSMFQITPTEWYHLMRSQIVTASGDTASTMKKRNTQHLPYAFTEHGVTMLASVLRSEQAIAANIFIVRAFIALRQIGRQFEELSDKLAKLENSNKEQFGDIYKALNFLVEQKQQEQDFKDRTRIGFTPA